MSRTQAAGRMNYKTRTRSGGQITTAQMLEAVRQFGVVLRGAGTDESPLSTGSCKMCWTRTPGPLRLCMC